MSKMIHPETYQEYCSPVLAGEAAPTVYHSLVEAAIRDGVAPERVIVAWCLRESLWSAVSVSGAALLWLQHWWLGLAVMVFSLWAGMKHTKPMNVRLGYCATVNQRIGNWAVQRGHVSLIPIPPEQRESWAKRNKGLVEQAERDVHMGASRAATFLNIGSSAVLLLAKLALGVLLIVSALRHPGWLSIGIGGTVGAFLLLQSLVRLPLMFSDLGGSRRTVDC